MKNPLKTNVLKVVFLLTVLFTFLHGNACAEAIKGNVADAVKEARQSVYLPLP